MTPEDWARVGQLYQQAMERPFEERTAFLAQVCSDQELLAEVQALIEAHEKAGDFLLTPALEVAARMTAARGEKQPPEEVEVDSANRVGIGARLGVHEIVSLIGEGGMGQVFRARDTKLKRSVAIKVLPNEFARDSERLARFQREGELLASLNHPHIATIHDVQEVEGTRFLVLELVEGETLADRLKRGPISCSESLQLALQLAEALEAAHSKDVVHRDLKPANIKVTPEGKVKVLDFGLAKAVVEPETNLRFSEAPTGTPLQSRQGIILGTAPYMSPEQARGQAVDRTSDNWAFGCVLYEMLCGSRAFAGVTTTDILSNIIQTDPDWTLLPSDTPMHLRLLLKRCLQKDRRRRLQHIGDARIEIEQILVEPEPASTTVMQPVPRSYRLVTVAGLVTLLVGGSGAAILYWRPQSAPVREAQVQVERPVAPSFVERKTVDSGRATSEFQSELRQLELRLTPTFDSAGHVVISPNGKRVAYRAAEQERAIWVRELEGALVSRMLPGTEGAQRFSWSPDSKALVFCTGSDNAESAKLKKIDIDTNVVQPLSDASQCGRMRPAWSREEIILFTRGPGALARVSASGGQPTTIAERDLSTGENVRLLPSFLPDGRHYLYMAKHKNPDNDGIYIGSLDSKARTPLIARGITAKYANGYIFYALEHTLMARPFDAKSLEFSGEAVTIAEDLAVDGPGVAGFDLSDDGSLIYATSEPSSLGGARMVWQDRKGNVKRIVHAGVRYETGWWRLTADEKRLAFVDGGVTVYDFSKDLITRLTASSREAEPPVWSPDGKRLVYSARTSTTDNALYEKIVDSGTPERLILPPEPGITVTPLDWSADGQRIVYTKETTGLVAKRDLWVLPLSGDTTPFEYRATPSDEHSAAISPDGHWLAYVSNESGKPEVWVQSFPDKSGHKEKVSRDGGWAPRWNPKGGELFYLKPDGHVTAVYVKTNPQFELGDEVPLPVSVDWPNGHGPQRSYPYDVSSDGLLFLVMEPRGQLRPESRAQLRIVLNWPALLKPNK